LAQFSATSRKSAHQVFAEFGLQLKKFDFPATRQIEIRQRLQANIGDRITFDYVVRLKSGDESSSRAYVRSQLVNISNGTASVLFECAVNGSSAHKDFASKSRQSASVEIPVAGNYELRSVTSIDQDGHGAEAHLLVDCVRLTNDVGAEIARLASFSCVGRADQ
jgi:hypothetical protein